MLIKTVYIIKMILATIIAYLTLIDSNECDVCTNVLQKIDSLIPSKHRYDVLQIENIMRTWCDTAKDQDKKMCYYMGVGDSLEGTSGGFKRDISSSFTRGISAERLCKRLKKKDGQICELHYKLNLDADTNFNNMKIKDLRKICDQHDIDTSNFIEKNEFVKELEKVIKK